MMNGIVEFFKTKNQLEEGGRTSAPVQRDSGEPEKNARTATGDSIEPPLGQ